MAVNVEHSSDSGTYSRNGLTFYTETVQIVAVANDQLSAYRTRNTWTKTLHRHFLLQAEQDFDISISPDENESYIISCNFSSACGRYAFWRLINQQSPEAERNLLTPNLQNNDSPKRGLFNSLRNFCFPANTAVDEPERKERFLERVFGIFL